MKRIGLLSDTHSFLDERIFSWFEACDEVWHAGDIGNMQVAEQLEAFRPLRAVYGNIDGSEIRSKYSEDLRFQCEGVDTLITHIGGYPGKYSPRIRPILLEAPPKLFICGHSHILKVIPDKTLGLLHINPGACGKEGFHKVKTIVRFMVEDGRILNLEVVEF
jgi:putative phosphoesterase